MAMNLDHATARRLIHDLTDAGLKIPKDLAAAIDALAAVEALKPPDAPHDVAAAYLSGDLTLAHEHVLARLTAKAKRDGWAEAVRRASVGVAREVTGNGLDLLKQMQAKATPLIADLTTAAGIGADLQGLVREGRTADARIIADVEITAATLSGLCNLRGRITSGADYGAALGYDCGTWRDPARAPRPVGSVADTLRAGIRVGGGLWFPTPAEAHARAAELKAAADRDKAAETQGTRRKVAVARGY